MAGCGKDPLKGYETVNISPEKTELSYDFYSTHELTDCSISSYEEYLELGLDLKKEADFFEENFLAIVFRSGSSSENITCTQAAANGKSLFLVVESNEIKRDENATADVQCFAFYLEVPKSSGYVFRGAVSVFRKR